jgi:adenylate cyclase class IV
VPQDSHCTQKEDNFAVNRYTICLDEVEKLGTFIEIEYLAKGSVTEQKEKTITQDMYNLLDSLGIQYTEKISKQYDRLLFEKRKQS